MSTTTAVMTKALRKLTAAAGGLGYKAVAIGAIGQQVRGSKREVPGLDVLVSSGPAQRESLLSAARGEGLQQAPDQPLQLRYGDAAAGTQVTLTLVESSTPFHAQVISRAEPSDVLSVQMLAATCEDLIVLGAPRSVLVELLRANAARIDGAYLKREAEAAGIFAEVKLAWQEAKQQG
jgi:hypothetical protein